MIAVILYPTEIFSIYSSYKLKMSQESYRFRKLFIVFVIISLRNIISVWTPLEWRKFRVLTEIKSPSRSKFHITSIASKIIKILPRSVANVINKRKSDFPFAANVQNEWFEYGRGILQKHVKRLFMYNIQLLKRLELGFCNAVIKRSYSDYYKNISSIFFYKQIRDF